VPTSLYKIREKSLWRKGGTPKPIAQRVLGNKKRLWIVKPLPEGFKGQGQEGSKQRVFKARRNGL